MGIHTSSTVWPLAIKTIAIGGMGNQYSCPNNYSPPPTHTVAGAETGLEIMSPVQMYKAVGLYMKLNYTFDSVIAPADQVLLGIYVRDTPNMYVNSFGSSIEKYMPLNIAADASRNITINLDLSTLIVSRTANVVFLHFNQNCSALLRSSGVTNGDTINLWKLDLVYQTIGIRNEK